MSAFGRPAAGALALALVLAAGAPAAALGVPAADAPAVTVVADRSEVSTVIGGRFSFTSTIRAGDAATGPLIAHLNILGLDPETYVDPEDWSSERTQYVADLPAGGSADLSWTVQTVNDGTFLVYVAVAGPGGGNAVTAGPAIRAEVASQRVLNAGGILPIVAAVPGVLLVLTLATRLRRRRVS